MRQFFSFITIFQIAISASSADADEKVDSFLFLNFYENMLEEKKIGFSGMRYIF